MKLQLDDTRRVFLKKLIAASSMMGMAPLLRSLQSSSESRPIKGLPQRPFGSTGEMAGIYSPVWHGW